MGDNQTVISRVSLSAFIVDFFGALIPGLLFVFLLMTSFIFPIYIFIKSLTVTSQLEQISFTYFIQRLDSFAIVELTLFVLMISFVVGSFFYRLDPKKPDSKSCTRTLKRMSEDGKQNWVERIKFEEEVQKDYLKKRFFLRPFYYIRFIFKRNLQYRRESKKFEFPYRFLQKYLTSRGLFHLADKVTWKGENDDDYKKRSKNFINVLKTRIAFHFPDKCETIIKNEAHIRLTSTMWYISKELILLSFVGLLFSLGTMFVLHFKNIDKVILPISLELFVIAFSFWIYDRSLKFLHYQRVREIIFVLETAYIVSRFAQCEYIFSFTCEENANTIATNNPESEKFSS